jgi:hypothetical protein
MLRRKEMQPAAHSKKKQSKCSLPVMQRQHWRSADTIILQWCVPSVVGSDQQISVDIEIRVQLARTAVLHRVSVVGGAVSRCALLCESNTLLHSLNCLFLSLHSLSASYSLHHQACCPFELGVDSESSVVLLNSGY